MGSAARWGAPPRCWAAACTEVERGVEGIFRISAQCATKQVMLGIRRYLTLLQAKAGGTHTGTARWAKPIQWDLWVLRK
jgi:hypothetical protein